MWLLFRVPQKCRHECSICCSVRVRARLDTTFLRQRSTLHSNTLQIAPGIALLQTAWKSKQHHEAPYCNLATACTRGSTREGKTCESPRLLGQDRVAERFAEPRKVPVRCVHEGYSECRGGMAKAGELWLRLRLSLGGSILGVFI